jgi:hypothetical protein
MSNSQQPGIFKSAPAPWPRTSITAALGAALLPLLAMGVVARPAWQWQRTDLQLRDLRERVALADNQAFRHDPKASRALLAATGEVRRELLALLPARFDRVELFSLLRRFAGEAGIGLQTLQLGKDSPLGLGQSGLDVARLELELRGSGVLGTVGALIACLDEAGLPADVDQLTVALRADGSYDLALQLGLFHWIPAQPSAEGTDQP